MLSNVMKWSVFQNPVTIVYIATIYYCGVACADRIRAHIQIVSRGQTLTPHAPLDK